MIFSYMSAEKACEKLERSNREEGIQGDFHLGTGKTTEKGAGLMIKH
jgi:hypothetical protein